MKNEPGAVADLIKLSGGKLIGRTRLQKSAFIFECLGIGYGFDFNYHYYGPYSEELALSAEDAVSLDLISEKWEASASGVDYVIYDAIGDADISDNSIFEKRRKIINLCNKYDAVSLEIAATALYLERNGHKQDFWQETKRRKSSKFKGPREGKAKALFDEINTAI